MNLFSVASEADQQKNQPLAYRMRPRTLDEYIGQDAIIGEGRLLRRSIQADQLSSVIFYGPPGTGKTTLARVIANTTKRHFSTLNAVLSGVKELRYEIDEARQRRTVQPWQPFFVDECIVEQSPGCPAALGRKGNGSSSCHNRNLTRNAALSRSRYSLKSLEVRPHGNCQTSTADKERGSDCNR